MSRTMRLRTRMLLSGLIAGFAGAGVGCFPQQTNRAQIAEDPEKDQYATVGSKTEIANTEAIPVSGVGLVYGLLGTGSSPQSDGWRGMLESSLKKRQLDVKLLLDNPEKKTSLVLVSTAIPAGSRIGDKLDVTITLPPGSKTTSLDHGMLEICPLSNFEVAGNARQQLTDTGMPTGKAPLASSNSLLIGSKLAIAEGPLVAGALATPQPTEGSDGSVVVESAQLRIAKVWRGCTCQVDRPYYFVIQRSTPQPKLAYIIASRLNSVFHAGDRSGKVADAKVEGGKPFVAVFVPPAYRHNHERFLMVARNVTIAPVAAGDAYRKKLEHELLSPATALEAAIKLEATGSEAESALRVGLESESPWVKFAAAQSLAYLGKADPRAAAVLSELAEKHPALRTHCLLALASQDDAPCVDQLVELMRKPNPSLRYGAFVALRTANETHEAVRGLRVGRSYTLHSVAPESEPTIHLTTDRRNEIVLFGNAWPLRGEFSFPLGSDFTISSKGDGKKITLTRLSTNSKPNTDDALSTVSGTYRPDLEAVLKGLAALGGGYSEAIEFVRRASSADVLTVPIAIDNVPRGIPVIDLVRIARVDPLLEKADAAAGKNTANDDIKTASGTVDVPQDGEAARAKPAEPALNRNPGSVLRPFDAEKLGPALNRNPGTLFGR